MDGTQINSITGVGSAAAQRVASALAPQGAGLQANPKAASTTDGTGSSTTQSNSGGATITGNDFLTLLVTELKNQDPTQPTDPNAYIQQLVGVNSLQQLIQINQGITSLGTTPPTTPPTTTN
ncbi:MAG: flagellar hook capping protein [Edaphobacter sp.]|nr:flagellar hook capping protein [Edaphobacter sp.]